MDITFKCPHCDQELEVDARGAGTEIECPSCSQMILVPAPEPGTEPAAEAPAEGAPPEPAKPEKHFSVPVHEHAPAALIKKASVKTLEVAAREGDKTMRIKTIKRTECQDVGKDHFDETVSAFLEQVGQANIVSITPITYSFTDTGTRHILADYGVLIVFRG